MSIASDGQISFVVFFSALFSRVEELYEYGESLEYVRSGHTIKVTPHPIPNCEVKLDGPVQYWG